jgi:hypothetical protein
MWTRQENLIDVRSIRNLPPFAHLGLSSSVVSELENAIQCVTRRGLERGRAFFVTTNLPALLPFTADLDLISDLRPPVPPS